MKTTTFLYKSALLLLVITSLLSCRKETPTPLETFDNTSGLFIQNSYNDTSQFSLRMSRNYQGDDALSFHFSGINQKTLGSTFLEFSLKKLEVGDYTIGTDAALSFERKNILDDTQFDANEGTITITGIAGNKVSGTFSVRRNDKIILIDQINYALTGSFNSVAP